MSNLRVLRRPEVEHRTGLARSTIYNLMKNEIFPTPVRVGPGVVGWLESEIDEYIEARIAERDSGE